MDSNTEHINQLVTNAQHIVIIQADNPDADSLASSLALEQILGEMGKQVSLYGGIDVPQYLRYMPGWDRVNQELPKQFDLSIIVDASTITLLQRLVMAGQQGVLASRPCIALDHHQEVENAIPFATTVINDTSVASTGELIYHLTKQHSWPLDELSGAHIMTSILGDTQGLANDLTTANTYRVMAELVELGVNRPKLEEQRRAFTKWPLEIFRYKAQLIERTEFHADNHLALVHIPHQEIMSYSPLYNPNPLIQGEHLQTSGVLVSVSIKQYADGRLTAAIRCNTAAPIAAGLAEHFGGGGHMYSSGFKITNGKPYNEVKSECIRVVTELLKEITTT